MCYRYRPFQQQLRLLGSFDYIDRFQYEGLCIHWNMIKTETQIVEMYFNQISLLIYPVVSSNALLSLNMTAENGNVSALTKINALIQSLVGHDEMTVCSSLPLKSRSQLINADATKPDYFSEEEFGLFIVNNIIEPLFQDEKNTTVAIGGGSEVKYDINGLLACTTAVSRGKKAVSAQLTMRKNLRDHSHSMEGERETTTSTMNDELQLQVTCNHVLINDLYNLIGNDLFRMDDKLLSEILAVNPFDGLTFSRNNFFVDTNNKSCKMTHDGGAGKRFARVERDNKDHRRHKDESSNFRQRYDHTRRSTTTQRKFQKRSAMNFNKNYPFEFVNKKFTEPIMLSKNFI